MSTLLHLGQALTEHVTWLADPTPAPAPGAGPGIVNTTAILGWIATRIAPILLGALGVVIMMRAKNGEVSKSITSSGVALLGLAVIAGATTLFFAGDGLVKLFFGS